MAVPEKMMSNPWEEARKAADAKDMSDGERRSAANERAQLRAELRAVRDELEAAKKGNAMWAGELPREGGYHQGPLPPAYFASAHFASAPQFGFAGRNGNPPLPEISREVENLANEITAAGESFHSLIQSIMPVMNMDEPNLLEKDVQPLAPQPATALGNRIRTETMRVVELRRAIEDATRKVML